MNCAAKVNLAFGFVLKNFEDGLCTYFYTHENNTVMERSKPVCTPNDIANLREKLQKMDTIDLCTRGRDNTKGKFYKLNYRTVFAALLKDIPMGCKDTVLLEPLLRNCNVNCLTFERNTGQPYNDNLCLFRALALYLHGNEKLEEEVSKIFNLFLNNSGQGDVSKLQGVHLNDLPKVVATQYLPLGHWRCGWRADWGTSTKKYSKVWKERQTFTLQQSHLLRQRHELLFQIFLLQHTWQNLFKDWKFAVKFDHM